MVKKIIEKTIKENNLINAGEHIVLGLSGGPDSVCLFSVLNELKTEMNFTLHAVHVNHGFRPGAAEEDQTYVEQLCAKEGVKCTSFIYDCNAIASEMGLSSEEAGRKVRYGSFYKVAEDLAKTGMPMESIKIAVAQNADDQAETVLLRLLRGTGPDGLAGMAYSRMEQNVCVIRPLLDTWRKDIESYCDEKQLLPRTDKTNLEPIYTRNKVRLQLIPYLKENFNPNILESLNRLSRIAGEDKEYLWKCAEEAYASLLVEPGVLKQQELAELPAPVRHRVMMKALQEAGLGQDVTFAHLEAADSILTAKGESRTAEFPGGYQMIVRYGEAAFLQKEQHGAQWELNVMVSHVENCYQMADFSRELLPYNEKTAKDNSHQSQTPGLGKDDSRQSQQATFDYEKLTAVHGTDAEIQLRTRRKGDYLSISKGRKKLQNFFVDEKVPKEHRDSVLVATIGSEILWIPAQPEKGVKKPRYSQQYKLDAATKKRVCLEIICES